VDDLLTRAQALGLRLLECATCRGTGLWCDSCPDVHGTWPTREASCSCCHDCPACNGTGEDRTPGGVLMAVAIWAIGAGRYTCVWDDHVTVVLGRHGDVQAADHDGTPESIARAALTAFVRAVGGEP